jgi:hypothetical protein
MLEIVILYFVHRRFARVARAKGRSGAWGWFGVAMWVTAEFLGIGLIDPSVFGSAADVSALLKLSAIGFGFGLMGLAAAWLVVRSLEPVQSASEAAARATETAMVAALPLHNVVESSGSSRAVPETEPAPAGSTFAGFCEECDAMVWLTGDQACPEHGRDTVGSIHRPL